MKLEKDPGREHERAGRKEKSEVGEEKAKSENRRAEIAERVCVCEEEREKEKAKRRESEEEKRERDQRKEKATR